MASFLLGKGVTDDIPVVLEGRFGNRHGLVAGATGTGKTVSLMTLAEGFSRLGVPVFLADVKGDVAGLAVAGDGAPGVLQRANDLGMTDYAPAANPVVFWDLYGQIGHPVRTTVSEMGPTLLARILELNDTQSGVLDIVFKLADDRGLLLLDLDDLRALLALVVEERKELSTSYGLVSSQSVAAIQRALLRLSQDGGEQFFGEPALELAELMRVAPDGRGVTRSNGPSAGNICLPDATLARSRCKWIEAPAFGERRFAPGCQPRKPGQSPLHADLHLSVGNGSELSKEDRDATQHLGDRRNCRQLSDPATGARPKAQPTSLLPVVWLSHPRK